MNPFGSLLKQLRTERGRKLKEVAAETGYHITQLSSLETGRRTPPKDESFYERLRMALDLSDEEAAELKEHARHATLYTHLGKQTSQQQAQFLALMFDIASDLQPWEMRAIRAIVENGRNIREPSLSLRQKGNHEERTSIA